MLLRSLAACFSADPFFRTSPIIGREGGSDTS